MNNYTQNITLAHAHLDPIYMQVLKNFIDHGPMTRSQAVKNVWHTDLKTHSNGWNCGPFTLHRELGHLDYDKKSNLWSVTENGKKFYNGIEEHMSVAL